MHCLMHWLDAMVDPWPPFTFCRPQAIVRTQEFRFQTSPFPRSTRLPFTTTASPPAPLAIRKAPSASVESIEPRPPRPSEVGRPKGRRRKNRRQSHKFFLAPARLAPQLAATPWGGSPPRPSAKKSATQTAQAQQPPDALPHGHRQLLSLPAACGHLLQPFLDPLLEPLMHGLLFLFPLRAAAEEKYFFTARGRAEPHLQSFPHLLPAFGS